MSKVGRSSYVRTEPTVHIVGDQHRVNQKNHMKWKREQAKLDDYWVQKRKQWGDKLLPPENMTCRVGGLILSIPHEEARWLVHKRLAGVIGYYENRTVDAIIESHDLSQFLDAFGLGAENEPTQEPESILIALREAANGIPADVPIQVPRSFGTQFVDAGLATIVESGEPAMVITAGDLV